MHAPFARDPVTWVELVDAIERADAARARGALEVLVGEERTGEVFALDPVAESAAPSAGPSRSRRATQTRSVTESVAASKRYADRPPRARRRPVEVAGPEPVTSRTVLRVGSPRTVPRARHDRSRKEIQRWVTDFRVDPPTIIAVPRLEPGTATARRWREELQIGELVCPWPGCPAPRLILKAGPILATHVAHRPGAEDHGANTNWVLSTLAQLARLAGATPMPLIANPPTVRLGDIVVVLLHERLGVELEAAATRAQRATPDGAATVAVLRASLLPRRFVPVQVHGEPGPRWGFPSGRERTLTAIAALQPFDRVLGAPDHPDPEDDHSPDSRWGERWIGLGLETSPGGGRLDWRDLHRLPLVAVALDEEIVRRVVRPSTGSAAAERSTVADVPEYGHEMEAVGFEEAGPVLRCFGCGLRQTVSDGITTEEVEEILDRVDDEDEQGDALAVHDVRYCVYDACPRCGDGIDIN